MSYRRNCPECKKLIDFTHLDFSSVICIYCKKEIKKENLEKSFTFSDWARRIYPLGKKEEK